MTEQEFNMLLKLHYQIEFAYNVERDPDRKALFRQLLLTVENDIRNAHVEKPRIIDDIDRGFNTFANVSKSLVPLAGIYAAIKVYLSILEFEKTGCFTSKTFNEVLKWLTKIGV